MARTKGGSISQNKKISFGRKRKRPGVISKKKNSKLKSSRNYRKKYRGQGR